MIEIGIVINNNNVLCVNKEMIEINKINIINPYKTGDQGWIEIALSNFPLPIRANAVVNPHEGHFFILNILEVIHCEKPREVWVPYPFEDGFINTDNKIINEQIEMNIKLIKKSLLLVILYDTTTDKYCILSHSKIFANIST